MTTTTYTPITIPGYTIPCYETASYETAAAWAAEANTLPGVVADPPLRLEGTLTIDGVLSMVRHYEVTLTVDNDPRARTTVSAYDSAPAMVAAKLRKNAKAWARENRRTQRTIAESHRW